ncbi:hypothetical protein PCCS19_42360 [Paenibacillus sp. CCS19]|nr:hypothetical protein PCCS19_42360 [Paenibacillus cellulosilyticus]
MNPIHSPREESPASDRVQLDVRALLDQLGIEPTRLPEDLRVVFERVGGQR